MLHKEDRNKVFLMRRVLKKDIDGFLSQSLKADGIQQERLVRLLGNGCKMSG